MALDVESASQAHSKPMNAGHVASVDIGPTTVRAATAVAEMEMPDVETEVVIEEVATEVVTEEVT